MIKLTQTIKSKVPDYKVREHPTCNRKNEG